MEEICAISDNMTPEDAGLKITGKQEVFSRGGGGGGGDSKKVLYENALPRDRLCFKGFVIFPVYSVT